MPRWRKQRRLAHLAPALPVSSASASRCTNRTWRGPGSRDPSRVPELAFAVPGDLATPTGGYVYARKLLELLPGEGFGVRHLALPGSFPHPTPTDLAEATRQLGSLPAGMALLVDGL